MRLRWDGSMWRNSAEIDIPNATHLSINPSLSVRKVKYRNSPGQDIYYSHLVWEERKTQESQEYITAELRYGIMTLTEMNLRIMEK